jgi:hypothetical protein
MVFGQALGATATDADEDGDEGVGGASGLGTRVVPAGKRVSPFHHISSGIMWLGADCFLSV